MPDFLREIHAPAGQARPALPDPLTIIPRSIWHQTKVYRSLQGKHYKGRVLSQKLLHLELHLLLNL